MRSNRVVQPSSALVAVLLSVLGAAAQPAVSLASAPRATLASSPAGASPSASSGPSTKAPTTVIAKSQAIGLGGSHAWRDPAASPPARVTHRSTPATAWSRNRGPATTFIAPQLLSDTGFESGSSSCCWFQTSSGGHYPRIDTKYYSICVQVSGCGPADADGGSYAADLCGYANCNPDKVGQGFTVPRNVTTGTLNFSLAGACPPSSGTCAQGSNENIVGLIDGAGNSIVNTYYLGSPPGFITNYLSDSVDVGAWLSTRGGQAVTVFVEGLTAGSDESIAFYDNITLNVGAAPDPPGGISAVSSNPGQAVVSWTTPPSYQGTSALTGYTVATYNAQGQLVMSQAASSPATISGLTNGQPYYFTVASNNSAGTGPGAPSNSVTPVAGTTPPARMTAPSTQQYTLPNSDGVAWQVLDEGNLSLSVTPSGDEDVLLTANADLWTWNAGYNQDIGIAVNGTTVAWKESGGFAGTFSPNAAFLETVYHMAASNTYSVELVWKTNKRAIGASISAGAGPISGVFSPTRLNAKVLPAGFQTAVSQQQYTLPNSDGSTWQPVDDTNLKVTLNASSDEDAVVSGNADMWTWNAGYNQDIGIAVSCTGPLPCAGGSQPDSWKESGGFAGTFSPNAAYVQTVVHLAAGYTYTFELVWKTNKPAGGAQISAGAGPISGNFSPTRLTAWVLPSGANLWGTAVSTQQYMFTSSDGANWAEVDAANLSTTLMPGSDADVLVSGNSDLWTSNAGYNQDIAVFVTDNGGPPTLVAWKESGGFGGTFSPNAAFVQSAYHVVAGHTYVFSLYWKANKAAAGATIWAGAGPINGAFSPTRLSVVPG